MNKNRISISEPQLSNEELKYIKEAFTRNEFSSYGLNIDIFEFQLQVFLGTQKEVTVLNSGTSAIHLGLILAGVEAGDEVVCQSMTFSASTNPIVYQGAIPVFVDSEEETWNICPNHLEKAIVGRIANGKKPKAIVLVHSYGMPAKVDEIIDIAKKYKITLIEDAAEALGSIYKDKKCGTFGKYAALSFNGNKIITTSGGGAIVCHSKEAKDKAIFLATQARDDAPHYQHSEIGYNYRMSNIVAGIGRGQMEVLDKHILLRREMHKFYKSIFKNIAGVKVFEEPDDNYYSNHWLSCIIIDESIAKFNREDLRLALLKENIESRPLWKPMHLQPVFEEYPYYGNDLCENLFKNGLCLPSGSNLTEKEKALIKKTIINYVNC
ncbi:DegT/DnrJ/EryC1/StrS family aminotransferase [Flavobacteriaceae bacterium MHTCC 0001]